MEAFDPLDAADPAAFVSPDVNAFSVDVGTGMVRDLAVVWLSPALVS